MQNEYSFQCYWWVLQGSNLRPTACKAVALPTELNTQHPDKEERIVPFVDFESRSESMSRNQRELA